MKEKRRKETLRKAKSKDVRAVQELINTRAKSGQVLPRSLNDIYESLRDFVVCADTKAVYGCCALHVTWEYLAEIRSLVVHESKRSRGIGCRLVEYCLKEAKMLGIKKVFLLTEKPAYFEKLGFKPADKSGLPHKIWTDCVQCVKFPECNETAMIKDIN